tara:strand:+ start:761 stop:1258 length:498 start_codon:yes stop_codon:yes gene_type:complete
MKKRNITPTLRKIVEEIQNIPERIGHDVKKKGGFYLDFYLNKCLETIDRVNELSNITTRQKLRARKDIFNVYFKLQDYKGPEVQSHKKERRIYSGGLGYASLANAVITQRIGKAINHYWKPPKKKPAISLDMNGPIVYNKKPTVEDWRGLMTKQKQDVLLNEANE